MRTISIPRPLLKALRFIFIVAPLLWIYRKVDTAQLVSAMHSVAWWTIPLLISSIVVTMFLQGYRWWILMRAFLPKLPFGQAIGAHFKGLFYSIALPSSAAQDIVRATMLATKNDYAVVWGATWLSRLLGLFVLAALSLVGLWLQGSAQLPSWLWRTILGAMGTIVALATLSFSKAVSSKVRPLVTRVVAARFVRVIEEIRQSIYLYRGKPGALSAAFSITLIVQLLVVINAVALVKGISGELCISECLFFIPAIEIIVISLPLTPNGMGVREGLLSLFLLSSLHLSAEQVGVYVLIGFLGVVLRLVGVIPVAWDMLNKPQRCSPS
jgi:uncharacterized membrane protein YbhN (UPF0104 family)